MKGRGRFLEETRWLATGVAVAGASLLLSCSSLSGPGGGGSRTYALGFTTFPHALTTQAVYQAWNYIALDADMAVLHFDGGVPWPEALAGSPYPQGFADEIAFSRDRLAGLSFDHVVYLAVTPISGGRDGLALYRSNDPNQPLPAPWSGYTFDSPDVVAAYESYCDNMIAAFNPDYFAYAIEANMLHWHDLGEWDAFLNLAEQIYSHVKQNHPELLVFVSLQADAYFSHLATQPNAVRDLLPYTDMIAVSGYPFTAPLDNPDNVRSDYFTALAELGAGRPFAVAETGWPAEPVGPPYYVAIAADTATQAAYVRRVLDDCDYLDARFICWFFSRDYDDAWETDFQYLPDAALYRLWRDTGLYDGDGTPREGLEAWRGALARLRMSF